VLKTCGRLAASFLAGMMTLTVEAIANSAEIGRYDRIVPILPAFSALISGSAGRLLWEAGRFESVIYIKPN
jgi:hypothetical protein